MIVYVILNENINLNYVAITLVYSINMRYLKDEHEV